ncbi:MAG: integration host factor subunit beta [Gammaproteobacteria bacterium]|jgi:integration host factor subunit beta|nr:integration host factor subunit beta [Gammaproteobacteria bacterium]
MAEQAINRSDLINRLAQKHNISPAMAAKIFKTVLDAIMTSLNEGQRVEIRGFGSFEVRYRKPRKARNPKTGEILEAPGKNRIYFRAGKEMNNVLNKKQ